MAEVEVRGAEQLAALAKALRQMGDKDLQRQLYAAINRATKPLKVELRASLARDLPKRGGLAAAKARTTKFRTTRRTGARQAGVRVTATGGQMRRLDAGTLRHPVFGNRDVWVTQKIRPGWFTGPTEAAGPRIRDEIEKGMQAIADEITARVKAGRI